MAFGRTVEELLDSMSWAEFQMWAAFDQLEPFGDRRADLLTAYTLMHHVNMKRDPKKRREPFPITDFLLIEQLRQRAAAGIATPIAITAGGTYDAERDGARLSMDTLAFLVGEAHKAGHKMDL